LPLDAVQPRDQRVIGRVAEFIRGHQPGPEAAGAFEILAQAELAVVALVLAHRTFIVARVARDMVERLLALDEASGLADDDSELAFIIVSLGNFWAGRPKRHLVPDLANRHAQENLRKFQRGCQSGLFDMKFVVECERPGGVRFADDRVEFDIVERKVRRFPGGRRANRRERRINLQNLTQVVRQGKGSLRQGNDAVGAGRDTYPGLPLVAIRYDFQDSPPRSQPAS